MSADEVAAFRSYVRANGHLHASACTSLVDTEGVRHDDFLLGDVLGAALVGEEDGRIAYFSPADEAIRGAMSPQLVLSQVYNDR